MPPRPGGPVEQIVRRGLHPAREEADEGALPAPFSEHEGFGKPSRL